MVEINIHKRIRLYSHATWTYSYLIALYCHSFLETFFSQRRLIIVESTRLYSVEQGRFPNAYFTQQDDVVPMPVSHHLTTKRAEI